MSISLPATFKETLLALGERITQRLVFGENLKTNSGLEAVYQRIFERELAKLNISNGFFPLGWAANYSLMYVLLRVACEFSPKSIVELGAGQTSLLLHQLSAASHLDADILTIEHDKIWAEVIGRQVSHRVQVVGMKAYEDGGLRYIGYDFEKLEFHEPIDLLTIDGPPAGERAQRLARHGGMQLFKHLSPEGFVIIVDDAERFGEFKLCDRIDQYLREKRIDFRRGQIIASKRQEVFASGRFLAAAYF